MDNAIRRQTHGQVVSEELVPPDRKGWEAAMKPASPAQMKHRTNSAAPHYSVTRQPRPPSHKLDPSRQFIEKRVEEFFARTAGGEENRISRKILQNRHVPITWRAQLKADSVTRAFAHHG
jgi:hypothetical protein